LLWNVWKLRSQNTRYCFIEVAIKAGLTVHVLRLEIQLSRGEGWYPINQLNPAIFLCLSQARTRISNVKWHGHIYVLWLEMRSDRLFCWYWRNCWISMFQLSFHNKFSQTLKLFLLHSFGLWHCMKILLIL